MFRKDPPQLLVVGPLPPPVAGTSVSFQIFCNEAQNHPSRLKIDVINSAPKHLGQYPLFTRAHFETAQRIVRQFVEKVRHIDQVLIFGPDQFLFSMASVCLNIAKVAGKPCYIRSFGGSLDRSYVGMRPLLRGFFRSALGRADGLIVETELLHNYFTGVIGDKVHYVPGYRPVTEAEENAPYVMRRATTPLRAIFVGHIREEKGVFVLLESLRKLAATGKHPVECDLYGPIYGAASHCFQQELAQTPNAAYKGLLQPEQVIPTLRQYDVLVFPTHYPGEGHPGVVIEAMMAGIPVITTRFRSVPEITQDGVNGLLVEPHNAQQLGKALQSLQEDRQLLATMGQKNWEMRSTFSASCQVPRILQPLGIHL